MRSSLMEPRATPWVTEAFTLLSVRQKQQRRPWPISRSMGGKIFLLLK